MKITKIGTDYITVNETNMGDEDLINIPRVHLIKLDFENPSSDNVKGVLTLFTKTNRYVIDDNIKIYNALLKTTTKKFYVENRPGQGLISFFRKNNKVLLNVNNLRVNEKDFILDDTVLPDILRNIEVIQLDEASFRDYEEIFQNWRGNVILS